METRWYDISIDPTAKIDTLLEKSSKTGKYARRDDIEPILRKYSKENKEMNKLLEDIKYNIQTFRSQFSKSDNEGMLIMCNSLLQKLKGY